MYSNEVTFGPLGPSASNNLSVVLPEALYNSHYLPKMIRDPLIQSTASFALTDAVAAAKTSSFNYKDLTSKTVQQFLAEMARFYGIKGSHIVGKKATNYNTRGEPLYTIDGEGLTFQSGSLLRLGQPSGSTRPATMYVVLEKTPQFNNTTTAEGFGPWPYYQNMAPCDSLPWSKFFLGDGAVATHPRLYFTASSMADGNFLYASSSYSGDKAVLKFKYTPTYESFTWQEALFGSNTEITYYKDSLAATYGTGSLIHQGADLRDCLRFTKGPSGEQSLL